MQTVYFTFATQREILTKLMDVGVAGDAAPIVTLDRPWVAQAMAVPPAELLRHLAAAAGPTPG